MKKLEAIDLLKKAACAILELNKTDELFRYKPEVGLNNVEDEYTPIMGCFITDTSYEFSSCEYVQEQTLDKLLKRIADTTDEMFVRHDAYNTSEGKRIRNRIAELNVQLRKLIKE